MLYLLPQHSDAQSGMYNQPRARFLQLLFRPKTPRPKITTTENVFEAHTEFSYATFSMERRQPYILVPILATNRSDIWKPPIAQYLEPMTWIIGADSCFGSSSTVVTWVPLLLTQAYTVQASIWRRRTWISHTQLCYLLRPLHPRFYSFLFNRFPTTTKIL